MEKHPGETNQAKASLGGGLEPLDRRGAKRFPVRQDLQYWVVDCSTDGLATAGGSLDVSSSGILLSTQEWIQPGRILVVLVDWPARLDGVCEFKFVAIGTVVRSEDRQVAMRIHRYEFCARGLDHDVEAVAPLGEISSSPILPQPVGGDSSWVP